MKNQKKKKKSLPMFDVLSKNICCWLSAQLVCWIILDNENWDINENVILSKIKMKWRWNRIFCNKTICNKLWFTRLAFENLGNSGNSEQHVESVIWAITSQHAVPTKFSHLNYDNTQRSNNGKIVPIILFFIYTGARRAHTHRVPRSFIRFYVSSFAFYGEECFITSYCVHVCLCVRMSLSVHQFSDSTAGSFPFYIFNGYIVSFHH